MKAVMPVVPPDILEWRRRTGASDWDEMWEGVLHMPPMPNWDHQDLEGALETWLRTFWTPGCGGRVAHNVNIARPGRWPDDYRIPDLVLMLPERFHINRNEYLEGGPDVVVEIRSPGDESYDKLGFYCEVGVLEAWVIDRDTRIPQIFSLCPEGHEEESPHADGWLRSRHVGVCLRQSEPQKLQVRIGDDEATSRLLP